MLNDESSKGVLHARGDVGITKQKKRRWNLKLGASFKAIIMMFKFFEKGRNWAWERKTWNNKNFHGKTKNFKKENKIYNLWTITITKDSTNQDIHMQKTWMLTQNVQMRWKQWIHIDHKFGSQWNNNVWYL